MIDRPNSDRDRIFRSEKYLSQSYVPETAIGREEEKQKILKTLNLLTKRKQPEHLLIHGRSGTGKTTCVKQVIHQIEQETSTKTAYINCWQYNTRPSLLTELLRQLGYPIPRKGKPIDELLEKLQEWLNKYRNAAVVLDEFDQLQDRTEVIYDLHLVSNEAENNLGLVMISNKNPSQLEMDPRSYSRMNHHTLEFEPYSIDELIEILNNRIESAFQPGTVSEEIPRTIAEKVADNGSDCRHSFQQLLQAGRRAAQEGAREVTPQFLRGIDG